MMRQAASVTSPDKDYLWHPSGMRGSGTGTGGLRGAPTSGYELSSLRDEGRMHSLSTPRAARGGRPRRRLLVASPSSAGISTPRCHPWRASKALSPS